MSLKMFEEHRHGHHETEVVQEEKGKQDFLEITDGIYCPIFPGLNY